MTNTLKELSFNVKASIFSQMKAPLSRFQTQYIELLGQKNGTAKLPAFIAMDW